MLPTSQQLFLFVNSMCGSRAHCPSNLIYSRYQYLRWKGPRLHPTTENSEYIDDKIGHIPYVLKCKRRFFH